MIIAHDLGTTGDKASLHDDTGRTLATVTADYPTDFGVGGVAEQETTHWWDAVGRASRELLRRFGARPEEVKGVGLSGQMMGAVFLDEAGTALRPAIIWADRRSMEQADRLRQAVGPEPAYRELGHRVHPTYTLAKIMWVKENEPHVWRRTRHICTAKDTVAHAMTGEFATDPSDASGTNAWDQSRSRWSTAMLEASGIPEDLLPPVRSSTHHVGGLTRRAAEHLGLPSGTPVILGGGDGPMAAVGAGAVAPDDAPYVCLGSSSWIQAVTTQPLHDPQMRSMTFDHVVPGLFVPTATMQAGGAAVSWALEALDVSEQDKEDLLADAGRLAAADEGLHFLPHLMGERSPYWNANAGGAFLGLQRHHEAGHMLRAVMEGVALNLRTCIDAFTENGIPIDALDVIGGGAQNDVWMQILADAWQIPVRRRTIVAEANSLGAAVTASVGLGLVDDFSVARDLSTTTSVFDPNTARADRAREHHAAFLDAYSRLEPWFDDRAREE